MQAVADSGANRYYTHVRGWGDCTCSGLPAADDAASRA